MQPRCETCSRIAFLRGAKTRFQAETTYAGNKLTGQGVRTETSRLGSMYPEFVTDAGNRATVLPLIGECQKVGAFWRHMGKSPSDRA